MISVISNLGKVRKTKTKLNACQMDCIDGLRAIAVLMVIFLHYKTVFAGTHGVLAVFSTPGVVGVVLFFVISGFCITLSKSEHVTWMAFYIRRVFRLMPALWVGMALVFIADYFLLRKSITIQDITGVALVLPQYYGHSLTVNPPLWSLQTEAEFYLLFPFMLYLFLRLSKKQFVTISLGVSIVAYAIWLSHFHGFTYYPPFPAFCHVIIWNSGLLLAYDTFQDKPHQANSILIQSIFLLVIGAVLLLLRNYLQNNNFAFWYFISGYGCYLMTKWALMSEPKLLRSRIMSVIGKRSYSLYILHLPIAYICVALLHQRLVAFITAVIVTSAVVEVLYRWVEMPLIKFGKRLTINKFSSVELKQAETSYEQATV